MGGRLNLFDRNFLTEIAKADVGKNGYAAIVSADRKVIVHPNPTMILQNVLPRENASFDQAVKGFEGSLETVNPQGLHNISSYKRLKVTNWIMAANFPQSEAYASIQQARKMILLGLMPITVAILAVSLFTLYRLLRPLQRLTGRLQLLTRKQNTAGDAPSFWNNEIDILDLAFQSFVEQSTDDQLSLLEAKNQAETERTKSEAIIAAIGDALIITDTEFKTLYQNQAARDAGGNLMGMPCYRAIHHREEPYTHCALAKTFLDGQVHHLEHWVNSIGRCFEITVSPIRDAEGKIVAGIELVRDITERKAAEERLRQSEQLLAETQRIAHIGSFDWDTQKNQYHWSEEMYRIFGKPPGDTKITIETVLHAVSPSHKDFYQEDTTKALETTKTLDRIFPIIRPDGSTRMVHSQGKVFDDETGRPARMTGICQDITERWQAEEQIRKLSLAIEQSPVLVMITDPAGRIEYINPKYSQVTGFAAQELLGRNASELGEQDPAALEEMWRTLAAGREWRGEFRHRKKNGEIFWEAAAISPVKDQNGTTTHFVKVAEDMTERRALELQLRHAQKMEAIGQLAAGIAHDFNNLLTAIVGYASIQQYKAAEGSTLKSDLAGILTAASRGTKLTRDLLDFSRKSNPEQEPTDFEIVDLNELVSRGSGLLQRMIGESIELIVQLAPRELPIRANRQNLEQALLNLGANARDAMPQGGRLCLHAKSAYLDQKFVARHGYGVPGRYAVLAVSDSGSGMDQETVRRIFEPFYTTKEVGKGTGLGLSITYGIIKQHQGFITCYSEPGLGTTFRLLIPLDKDSRQAQESQRPGQPAGGRETILLAEDDETARAMVRALLEEFGYQVLETVDGVAAVQLFKDQRATIGCLLLDTFLPEKPGIEVFQEIKALDPDARVIFCSGYPIEQAMEKGLVPPGADFLSKPFFPDQLLSTLRKVLDR